MVDPTTDYEVAKKSETTRLKIDEIKRLRNTFFDPQQPLATGGYRSIGLREAKGVVDASPTYGDACALAKSKGFITQGEIASMRNIATLRGTPQSEVVERIVEVMESLVRHVEVAAPNMINAGASSALAPVMQEDAMRARKLLIDLYQWRVMA